MSKPVKFPINIFEGMNEYQQALSFMALLADDKDEGVDSAIYPLYLKLQELVDKATPIKPTIDKLSDDDEIKIAWCKCRKVVTSMDNYCPRCGQRILWSESEEE